MEKVPTAEEFFLSRYFNNSVTEEEKKLWLQCNGQAQESIKIMVEFAKLHVESARKEIVDNIGFVTIESEELNSQEYQPFITSLGGDIYVVDKDPIMNAYPEDNIK